MYVSNIDFISLAKEYGTPLYVYELDRITERYTELKEAINYPEFKIHYAMKANYNPYILKHLLNLGSAIDTVSPAEVYFALECGFTPENIIFTANNLTNSDMHEIQEQGILFNLGSLSELKRYGKLFPESKVCLRLNPEVIAGAHAKIQTGGTLSKFGLLLEHFSEAIKICAEHKLQITGIHKHTGSGIKEQDKYLQAVDNLLSIINIQDLPDLEFIDFGGGLFVPYSPEEAEIDYKSFCHKIMNKFASKNDQYSDKLKLYMEPGKFLVAESGHFIIECNTIKNNKGHLIAGTNSGFNHLARPVLYDAYHHMDNISNPHGELKQYDVVGNICETGDNFASKRSIPEIREGDFLAIHNAGAYCHSMASFYNLRPLPSEVIISDNKATLVRTRTTNKDFAKKTHSHYHAPGAKTKCLAP